MKNSLFLVLIFFLSSCSALYKTSIKTNSNNKKFSPQKSIKNANKLSNSIEYIQAKAKVSFNEDNKRKSNTITLRIESDQKIWINASLGAARVLIDKDSIRYYNKIEKSFFVSDFEYINDIIGFDSNFDILQRLLFGIIIHKFKPSSFVEELNNNYVFTDDEFILNSKILKSTALISPYNFRVLKHSFYDEDNFFEVAYDDYTMIDGQMIPTKIRLISNGLESLSIEIKSITSPEKINLPFKIPNNYKPINLK